MGLRRCGMAAGEELLDPGQDPVGLGEPGRVVGAVDLEVPRAGNMVGEVAAALHRNGVLAGMDDQGGRGDRRQDRPHVDPEVRFQCRPHHPRARAHALEHRDLAYRRGPTDDIHLTDAPLPHAERTARTNS